MQQINSDLQTGIITISDKFDVTAATSSVDATPSFPTIGSEYTLSFINLQNVKSFDTFSYDSLGLTDTRYLRNYYRISRDGSNWTEWLDLKKNIDNFPVVDVKDPLYLDVKWVRVGTSTIGTIRILEYSINGTLNRSVIAPDSTTINLASGENIIWKPPFIYKVFKIDDIEIISTGMTDVDIKYRYSQDSSRTWSEWEPFTKENITTVRINPIRFFQIEYSITNNSSTTKGIQDINLIGDFQNVSQDYFKTNLYGIRDCCRSNMVGYYDANGNYIAPTNTNGSVGSVGGGAASSGVASSGVASSGVAVSGSGSGGCTTTGSGTSNLPELSSQDKANLYNPYQQSTAMDLLNKLSADAEAMFGFNVVYFCTDPDKKGQDHTMHEYQLYNVVCQAEIKAAVDGNNFPDSQIVMNQFDLSLFESMTVHITKKQFKEVFGPHRRPSKEDFLFFCDVNRMFQVDHAQQFRNFNNSAIYYKLILKKYTQKANVIPATPEIQNKLDMLTNNSTIEELFGIENKQDKDAIANKQQFSPLTRDPIRLEYSAEIDKELIENSSTIISKSYYDLATVNYQQPAIKYQNLKPEIKVSDNLGFMLWFRINNYVTDEYYNFIDYYNATDSIGCKVNLVNDAIQVVLNTTTYTFDLLGQPSDQNVAFEEDTWYCYILNVDQRQREMSQYIYKRNVDDEEDAADLPNTILRRLYQNTQTITPVSYNLETGATCQILASDMNITNIRLFMEIIPEDQHIKICNQYIIRDDSKYLVFADNATTRLYLPKFPLYE